MVLIRNKTMASARYSKNKGVQWQNKSKSMILESFGQVLTDEDITTAIMGENGEDLKLSEYARSVFPYSVECKAAKTGYTPAHNALEQAAENAKDLTPVVFAKQNFKQPIAILYLDDFLRIVSRKTEDTVMEELPTLLRQLAREIEENNKNSEK